MKTLPGSFVAAAACCFFFTGFPCNAADDKTATAPPLAVVRTWGDLVAQKPVMIQPAKNGKPGAAPVACKLGISGTTGEQYGGVVLYCLIERYGDEGRSYGGHEALGPFPVDVLKPGETQTEEEAIASGMSVAVEQGSACLYMKTIPLAKTGDYRIRLRELLDDTQPSRFETVAETTVKVLEKPGIHWSPWNDPDKEPADNSELADDDDYAFMIVANPVGCVAIPKWEGYVPLVFAKIPDGKLPLPQIIPAEADPGIRLSVKGSLLTVKLADEEMSSGDPDGRFLTRWWVNGKPVQLKTDVPGMKSSRASDGGEMPVKEVRFQVEFHPDRLGVKKGDTVGMQLLFCPLGWEYSAGAPGVMRAIDQEALPPLISRMSNRVDFVYSGNPALAADQ